MIDTFKNEALKSKQEELLKNMKMLRHTVADMLGSKSFLKDIKPGAQNGIIGINGEIFPVYITANTLAADGLPEITDDIFDEENYLSLISDDDLMWYALVEHLAHQTELLQEDNIKYSDDLVAANEEIDNLNCKVAEEIKARRGLEESLTQLREDLTAADNEIEGLEQSLREANQACTEYVHRIDKLENENESLKKKLFGGVPTKFGEQERLGSKQADEIIEDCEASKEAVNMDMEMAILHQNNLALNSKVTLLTSSLDVAQKEINDLTEELNRIKNNNAFLKKEKEEAELLAYRLTRGDMHVQFDSMKSLEHENGVLKNENADLNQKLYQKEDEDDLKKRIAEYAQKNDDLLERNKRLNQEINKLRVQLNSYSGATVVNNEDMQQTITKEAMAELTARINELESINENLRKENEDFTSIQEAHLETTAKFAEYKDRQKRLYKHFKNLAEMIEDLMELG